MIEDAALLHAYAEEGSETAFGELVHRHLNLVYSAALRQTGDHQLAEEVAQTVFTTMARKAKRLEKHPALVGWLYRTTRYAAIDAFRVHARRLDRPQEETSMHDIPDGTVESVDWARLRPVLDEAMNDLREPDRVAVLLRYFEGRSYAEVGARLNLGENAARMRVERALDRLRVLLARRGLTSTMAALSLGLATQAVTAAPSGLAASITTSAIAGAASAGTFPGLFSLLTMTKLKVTILAVAAAAILTLGLEQYRTRPVRRELAAVRQDNERLHQVLSDNPKAAAAYEAAKMKDLAGKMRGKHSGSSEEKPKSAANQEQEKPEPYRKLGNETSAAAFESFTGACLEGDYEMLGRLVYFDPAVRRNAEQVWALMTDSVKAQWKTPEDLYAFLIAADCLSFPPPPAANFLKKVEEVTIAPGRIGFRRQGTQSFRAQFQQTEEGWKYVIPANAVVDLPRQVLYSN